MEEDKISQLPDDILLLILDKIDTFEAVETTLLSHRWKNLWLSLPGLRFSFSVPCGCLHYKELISKALTLRQRVSQFLSHRDATAAVRDFHLSFDHNILLYDREFMLECVLYAINHCVQSLRLDWPTKHPLRLPAAFLTCRTLRELELGQLRSSVKVPGRLSLPNLRSFHIETPLVFCDDDISMEPFSGLPELEKLTLIRYCFPIDGLVIKAPKLRVLEIANSCKVKEIYTPLLTSFRYKSIEAWECANVNLPMLEHVYLDIHETRYCLNFVHHNFIRMLHQFGNASTVSLTLDTLKVLERNGGPFEQAPSLFPNMKCLKVMEGRHGVIKVYQGVMKYLRGPLCSEVEFSLGVDVVEQIFDDDKDNYEKENCGL